MANFTNHGGTRNNTGRPRNALDTAQETKDKGRIRVLPFSHMTELDSVGDAPSYLSDTAKTVFEATRNWLSERKVIHLISADVLEQFATAQAAFIDAHKAEQEYGTYEQNSKGDTVVTACHRVCMETRKQAADLWYTMIRFIGQNASLKPGELATPESDAEIEMAKLLSW